MAVSHAAFHVPRFQAARFRNVIPFQESAGASARESRRTVLPRAAETQGAVCGKDRKHAGTGRSFRRGVAAPTLVRESSQVGMVSGGLDRRNRNPGAESARDSITEKNGVTTVTGVIVQKDAPDDLVTAVPVYATTSPSNALVFLGEVLADGAETAF